MAGADWVMVCDVDEFLVIHLGDGRIGDLIGSALSGKGGQDIAGLGNDGIDFGQSACVFVDAVAKAGLKPRLQTRQPR